MLNVSSLKISYGHIAAVKGVSFRVPKGKIVALIGANGAGKTSILNGISGITPKLAGAVELDGQSITFERPDKIVRMGVCHVPEGRHVFPQLSVYENLIMGSLPTPRLSKKELTELVEEQYVLFPRLRERSRQYAGTLSGGEQQMLAIARGLMSRPKLLMLDEPSLGIAPIIIEEIFKMIIKIRDKGTTILLIEQNAALALSLADYAYALQLGNIVMTGTGRELISNPEIKTAYLGF